MLCLGVSVQVGLCPGWSLSGSLSRGLCPGGLCPGGSLKHALSGSLCPGRGLCPGCLCTGGLCLGASLSRETPLYGKERAVRILLLNCILVDNNVRYDDVTDSMYISVVIEPSLFTFGSFPICPLLNSMNHFLLLQRAQYRGRPTRAGKEFKFKFEFKLKFYI